MTDSFLVFPMRALREFPFLWRRRWKVHRLGSCDPNFGSGVGPKKERYPWESRSIALTIQLLRDMARWPLQITASCALFS